MAGSIKGITVKIGGDTTELSKALSGVNKKIRDTQSELKQVERLLKLDPTNTELLKQKQQLLSKSIKDTSDKLKNLKEAQKQAADQFKGEEGQEKYRALQREIVKTEQSLKNLESQASKSNATLNKIGGVAGNVAEKTKGLSLAAAGALTAVGAGLVKVGANADDLNTLAKQTGLTTAEIQKMKYASDLVDVSLESITGSMRKMTKNMVSTSSETNAAWETLGVNLTNVDGSARGVTDVFYDTLQALSKVRNETERDQLAMQIFGKSANDLAGIVDDGGAALRQLGEEAEKAGLIMSQDTIDAANEFNDSLDKLKASATASLSKIGSAAAKDLIPAMEKTADAIAKTIDKLSEMSPTTRRAILTATTLAAAISPTAKAIQSVTTVAGTAKGALTNLSKVYEKLGVSAKSANLSIGLLSAGIAASVALASAAKEKEEKLNKQLQKSIDEKYDKIINKSNKSYDTEIDNLEKTKNAAENKYRSEEKKLNDYYDKKIKSLSDDLKLQKKAIEEEKKAYESAHKERLKQLEKERDAKLSVINLERDQKTAALQAQIDALDEQTEAEEKNKEEQENAQKLVDLKQSILTAKTYAEKVEAQKNYTAEVKKQEEARIKKAREEQKKQLQDKINTLNIEAQKRTEEVNKEYNEAVRLENDKTTAAQEGFKDRLEALDGYVQRETGKLEALRQSNLKRMQKETTDYCGELQERINKEIKLKQAAEDRIKAEKKEEEKTNEVKKKKYTNHIKSYGVSWYDDIPKDYIGKNAKGTNDWCGGLTYVHEQGGELINLPQHTQIIPHDLSVEYMKALAKAPTTTNNNYGARQQVNVLSIGGQEVARVIQPTVSVGSANQTYGRRRAGYVRK